MPQSQKTLEFLQKLKDKGHWNDDYDYSEVEYVLSNEDINLGFKHYTIHYCLLSCIFSFFYWSFPGN